jgi:phage tail-like protein
MADDGSKKSGTVPLIPKFRFEVKWDNDVMSFQEISGLDVEAQPIEYRHGDNPAFSVIKMPGIKKYGDVIMKRGVFAKDNKFWDWLNQIKMNTIKRIPITISLLDEEGKPTMVWTLANAWPTKITGTDLKADGSEVAFETIEIAHEGLTIANERSNSNPPSAFDFEVNFDNWPGVIRSVGMFHDGLLPEEMAAYNLPPQSRSIDRLAAIFRNVHLDGTESWRSKMICY